LSSAPYTTIGDLADGMRGLPQPEPRRDVPVTVVAELLRAANDDLDRADGDRTRHSAEQLRLLLRLAADTGARRGELAALSTDDLTGRRLRIERGLSDEVLTTTKTGRARTITVASSTAELWQRTLGDWQQRLNGQRLGPWLFATDLTHRTRLGAGRLAGLFREFCRRHDHGDVTLHRLRHTVATVLVADGQLLQAQQRLGHRDASTTLRQYCHALPLADVDVADHLEQRYRGE
jgi:integrase